MKPAPFPRPRNNWTYHPFQRDWWVMCGVQHLPWFVSDLFRGWIWDIRYWKQTRHQCPICSDHGDVDVGDYGEQWLETCDTCGGSGLRKDIPYD